MPKAHISTDPADQRARARALAIEAARALDESKCEHVLVLDVSSLSQLTDFLVIGSGTSDRQMRTAIAKAQDAAEAIGHAPFRSSADGGATWLVLDFVDVVVHVFEPATRAHYDLEMLWGDAPEVDWATGARAGSGRGRTERGV